MNLAETIIHQQQPTPTCCSATCIAMAVGEPVESLGIKLDRAYDFRDFGAWLAEHGIWLRPMLLFQGQGERFHNGALYLIGARSLNNVNSDHAVLLDTRGPRLEGEQYNERSGWKCHDPNQGREGKKFYEWMDEHLALDACELRQHEPMYGRIGRAP
jgi:hypothetical protein